jgi:hypothetical protein
VLDDSSSGWACTTMSVRLVGSSTTAEHTVGEVQKPNVAGQLSKVY